MEKIGKPILIFFLAVVFTVLLIMPANVHAVRIDLPGVAGEGPGGTPACYCPSFYYYTCGCAIMN